MSTKSATWAKWPSQWLKSLPNPSLEASEGAGSPFGIGSPSEAVDRALKGSKPAPATVLRFEDFVERPLRSISQRQEQGRGRPDGETVGDGGSPDGGDGAGIQP